MRAARRRRNARLETYLAKVAQEIGRRTGSEIGVDPHPLVCSQAKFKNHIDRGAWVFRFR